MNQYNLTEKLLNTKNLIYTKLFFPQARLIRRPFYIRGKKSLIYKNGFTCGYGCRFDLPASHSTLWIGEQMRMGDRVHISALEKVIIGDHCLFASNIFISDNQHGNTKSNDASSSPMIPPNGRPLTTSPVSIGNRVWLGEHVCVLAGVTIGDGCIIGAGTIVTKDIPSYSMAVGNPAKVIKTYDFINNTWVANDGK